MAKFKIGLSLDDLYRQAYLNPLGTFEKWPIWEVQEKCLRELNNFRARSNEDADWAESCIKGIWEDKEGGVSIALDITEKILTWYIFSEKDSIVIRAIEFVISFRQHKILPLYRDSWDSMATKLIAGRLLKRCDHIELYAKIPNLQKYLLSFFDYLLKEREKGYEDADWVKIERTLRIVIKTEDSTFLEKVQEVIQALQSGRIFPKQVGPRPHYARASHMAALHDAEGLLFHFQ
jgi:hypothetical protein